ncbi:hypothetical protein GCM10025865_12840 [Paraoerskovia sediminicola]|uniref:Uncharacterized protein n=1 Tax=Paraoerskovia sediminicola TaxID=1138587 RepID=A0ABM8G1P8_9CELL|nr:hypothetical protein [Paraoerskovia sediminicola]BDZ41985.1 hypothetical protein GCM10025865_12840 [Paraoerskovia sediminicola]
MDEIQQAQQGLDAARQRLADAVHDARAQGRTWSEIGEALGMSKQAAYKRFGKPVDPATGEQITARRTGDVGAITEEVFRCAASGDLDRLEGLMHPRTAEELPQEVVAETWHRVLTEVGALERCEGTRVETPDGTVVEDEEPLLGIAVGATTLVCEAGTLLGRVAVDQDLRVVGILIVPPDHGPLPF